jgi:ribosomal protein L40E
MVAPPQAPPAAPLPAGLAPEDVAPTRPSFRDRGRLRRRLRYLRRVRELGFRDLGGLAFDLHRFGRRNDELVLGKLAALDAVDRELRAIERVLDERRDIIELREPGVAACPRCGALHGSDARFCPQCGTQFSGPLAMVEVGDAPHPAAPSPADPRAATATHEPPAVSAAALGATPVSGALEGNPPPEPPPPAPDPEPTPEPAAAEPAAANGTPEPAAANGTPEPAPAPAPQSPGGEPPTTVQPPPADQPTQAFGAVGDEARAGEPDGSALTSGDPLAPRERPEA